MSLSLIAVAYKLTSVNKWLTLRAPPAAEATDDHKRRKSMSTAIGQ